MKAPQDRGPLGLVEITIVIGVPTSMRCRRKISRLVLRIGSTSELSILAAKKSGAKSGVTRSSLYLPEGVCPLEPGLLKLPWIAGSAGGLMGRC